MAGNYYQDRVISYSTADCLSRHTLNSLLLCEDTGYLSVGHSLSVRYCQHDIAYCLSEWCCMQTYRRSEIWLFSTEITIEPFAGLREYRQLCFAAFFNKFMGNSISVPRTIVLSVLRRHWRGLFRRWERYNDMYKP